MNEIPLFPLKTVLLPANTLGLKIFEPRYLDMIANCMRENSLFGVVLIHKGEETGIDTDVYSIGTTSTISDWEHRADGLLGITALGVERFEILSTRTQTDGLTLAEIKILEDNDSPRFPNNITTCSNCSITSAPRRGVYESTTRAFAKFCISSSISCRSKQRSNNACWKSPTASIEQ